MTVRWRGGRSKTARWSFENAHDSSCAQQKSRWNALTMDPLSIEQITHFAGAVRQDIPAERIVTHLSTDSRTVQPGDLFVALRGENFDGHKFVNDAFLRGAVGAIVEQKWEGKAPSAFASSGLRIRSLPTSKSRPTTDVR